MNVKLGQLVTVGADCFSCTCNYYQMYWDSLHVH